IANGDHRDGLKTVANVISGPVVDREREPEIPKVLTVRVEVEVSPDFRVGSRPCFHRLAVQEW
ncbi:hypothetical protein PY650_35200, partial [Rhizobium calliandrae]